MIAVGIWAGVLSSKKEEFLKSYDITYKFGAGRTYSNPIPFAIQVKLFGPKAFVRAVTQKRFAPIVVDLAQAPIGTSYVEVNPDDVPVPMGVRVLEVRPATIPIRIEREATKELPLGIEVTGKVKEGLQVKALFLPNASPGLLSAATAPEGGVLPEPNRIRVRGAESVLKAANSIRTKPVMLDGLSGAGEIPVELDLESLPGV